MKILDASSVPALGNGIPPDKIKPYTNTNAYTLAKAMYNTTHGSKLRPLIRRFSAGISTQGIGTKDVTVDGTVIKGKPGLIDNNGDMFLIEVKLGQKDFSDVVTVLNANPFKIISCKNETLGDSSETVGNEIFPTVTWQGGTPPFNVRLVTIDKDKYDIHDAIFIEYPQENITPAMVNSVNLALELWDSAGVNIPVGNAREYILEKEIDTEGWWVDDLKESSPQKKYIGLLITDSNSVPRQIFCPFTAQTSIDGGKSKENFEGIYEEYGPPTSCEPKLEIDPVEVPFGSYMDDTDLTFWARIPATNVVNVKQVEGTITSFFDETMDNPTKGHQSSATDAEGNTPNVVGLFLHFVPDDAEKHYIECTQEVMCAVTKAQPKFKYKPTKTMIYGNIFWGDVFDATSFYVDYPTGTEDVSNIGETILSSDNYLIINAATLRGFLANVDAEGSLNNVIHADDFELLIELKPDNEPTITNSGDEVGTNKQNYVNGIDSVQVVVAKDTPRINNSLDIPYTSEQGIPSNILLTAMMLYNSYHNGEPDWKIDPATEPYYSYTVAGHLEGSNTTQPVITGSMIGSVAPIAPSVTPYTITMNFNPPTSYDYNPVGPYVFNITNKYKTLQGTWVMSSGNISTVVNNTIGVKGDSHQVPISYAIELVFTDNGYLNPSVGTVRVTKGYLGVDPDITHSLAYAMSAEKLQLAPSDKIIYKTANSYKEQSSAYYGRYRSSSSTGTPNPSDSIIFIHSPAYTPEGFSRPSGWTGYNAYISELPYIAGYELDGTRFTYSAVFVYSQENAVRPTDYYWDVTQHISVPFISDTTEVDFWDYAIALDATTMTLTADGGSFNPLNLIEDSWSQTINFTKVP